MRAAALEFEFDEHLHEHLDVEFQQHFDLDQFQLLQELCEQLELEQRDRNRALEFLELLLHQVLRRRGLSAIRS